MRLPVKTGFEAGVATIFEHLSGKAPARRTKDVGRNDPCPCGSGTKYKKCCLRKQSKSTVVRRRPADLEAMSSELVPRMQDESSFMADMMRLGEILFAIPEVVFDLERIERFLVAEGTDPVELTQRSGEEFDAVAVRFCEEVEADHWEKVAAALIRQVPSYLDSIDDLRAILTALFVLEQRDANNLVGIMLFREGVLSYIEGMLSDFARNLDDRRKARPSTDLGTLLREVVEGEDGQRLLGMLENSPTGQGLMAKAEEELNAAYQLVLNLMESGDFPLAPPWPLRLVTMSSMTQYARDISNGASDGTDAFVSRLRDQLHEDDLRLVATQIQARLDAQDDHPHRSELKQMALLCHARTDEVLVMWALRTVRSFDMSFAFPLEEEVVHKGSDATTHEIEALASTYDDMGYPAIADRIRRQQLEVFKAVKAIADSRRTLEADPAGDIDWDAATQGSVPTDEMVSYWLKDPEKRLGETLSNFIYSLEAGHYYLWEAVIREEQSLELTESQEEALEELIGFDDDDRIEYIDGLGRPEQPWYTTARRLAESLVRDLPVSRDQPPSDVETEGWPKLKKAIVSHAGQLDMPDGVVDPLEAIADGVRESLALQSAAAPLAWVDENDLAEDLQWRAQEVAEALRGDRTLLAARGTTISDLLERVVVPADHVHDVVQALLAAFEVEDVDRPIFR